jgi:hypothetical protein
MSLLLQRKVGWEKWASSKVGLFKASLLHTFTDLVSGEVNTTQLEVDTVTKLLELVSKLEQAPPQINLFQSEKYQTLLQAEATHMAELVFNAYYLYRLSLSCYIFYLHVIVLLCIGDY